MRKLQLKRESLNFDELASKMKVVSREEQMGCVGGSSSIYTYDDVMNMYNKMEDGKSRYFLNGGYLADTKSGVVWHDYNFNCDTLFKGVDISKDMVNSNAAYQLNGTIHIGEGWLVNGFSIGDFVHEYGHYLQQQAMGTLKYTKDVALLSLSDCASGNPDHLKQPYEIDATNRGNEYFSMYYCR